MRYLDRVPDWPERLVAHVSARARAPFAWGKRANDCASAAAQWVEAATGFDVLADLPDWDDEASALAAVAGVGGLAEGIAARLHETPVGLAGRGDVGVVVFDGRDFAVVVVGADVVGPGPTRLLHLPRAALVRAFRV